MAEYLGGHDANFTREVDKRFTCFICYKVFRDPHLMLCCGEKFCASCLEMWFKMNALKTCPHCRAEKVQNMMQHTLEKGMTREIESFEIYCSNREPGCKWKGELRGLTDHLESHTGCGYCEVQCLNKCESDEGTITLILRKNLQEHLNEDCELRLVKCPYCDHIDTMKNYSGHTKICELFPIDCPNHCGQSGLTRHALENHRMECRLEVIGCKNLLDGCDVKLTRQDMILHETEECELRPIHCLYCKQICVYKYCADHEKICERFPLDCPNQCGQKGIIRQTLQSHMQECKLEVIECKYANVGCKMQVKRKFMPQHVHDTQKRHLELMTEAYLGATAHLKEMTEKSKCSIRNSQELKETQQKLADKEVELKRTSLELEKMTTELGNMVLTAHDLRQQLEEEKQKYTALKK